MMRAVVYRGVNELHLEEVPVPRIQANELLVRVGACGVCPTDIKKIRYGTLLPPRIFGHETAGTVVRIGRKIRQFAVGDRVALHHHVPCLGCDFCRHRAFAQCEAYLRTGVTAGFEPAGGGYAEYVRVLPFCLPGVVKIPTRNSLREGAMLEPVNTVLKAVRQLPLWRGDTVLVVGQGPIGLLFNRLLTLAGMRVIGSDLLEERRKWGRKFGAEHTIDGADPRRWKVLDRLTQGRGVDAAVVAVPNDVVVTECHRAVRGGGSVLLFAHTLRGHESPVDLGEICVAEKSLLGSYSSDFTRQGEVARLVFSRRLDVRPLITHTFPLAATAAAIALAAQPTPDALKVMVEPTGNRA